jgi:hypothetical protein
VTFRLHHPLAPIRSAEITFTPYKAKGNGEEIMRNRKLVFFMGQVMLGVRRDYKLEVRSKTFQAIKKRVLGRAERFKIFFQIILQWYRPDRKLICDASSKSLVLEKV